jgi:hypothetical protein
MNSNKMFIDNSSIINTNVLDCIKNVAYCHICTGVIINPMQCVSCDNCFCKECIDSWLAKSKSCPFKCNNPNFKESRLTRSLLANLLLKCPFECGEEILYENLDSHKEKCNNNIVECPTCNSKIQESILKNRKNQNEYIDKITKENTHLKEENEKLNEKCKNLEVQLKYTSVSSNSLSNAGSDNLEAVITK